MNNAHPADLQAVARQVMLAHGFDPDFPPAVLQEVAALKSKPPVPSTNDLRDLRDRWRSRWELGM
ncbi:MAG: hypothetical protein DMG81_02155 [Acidobacteria bacterium]|nr:MAG: hypothetical protein DMG81_02155 [Acidobacteriota bacterium]